MRLAALSSSLAVHPSGRVAFLAQGDLVVLSLVDGTTHTVPATGASGAVITSFDGRWVVVAGRVDNQLRLTGFRCSADGEIESDAAWSAKQNATHEELGAFVGTGQQFVTLGPHIVIIRKVETGEAVMSVSSSSRYSRTSAVSPDGKRFAMMGYDKLYIWDTATWGTPTQVSGLNRWIDSMAFHPTRPIILATQNLQGLVKYLDAGTGKVIRKFNWKLGAMQSVAFSPDGTLAAAGCMSGKIVVWDVD
jgi:WD40 repeat protein